MTKRKERYPRHRSYEYSKLFDATAADNHDGRPSLVLEDLLLEALHRYHINNKGVIRARPLEPPDEPKKPEPNDMCIINTGQSEGERAMLDKTAFQYLKPTIDQTSAMEAARDAARAYSSVLEALLPEGPDKTYTLRKLREVAMWANVSITRHSDGRPRE